MGWGVTAAVTGGQGWVVSYDIVNGSNSNTKHLPFTDSKHLPFTQEAALLEEWGRKASTDLVSRNRHQVIIVTKILSILVSS